MTCSCNNQSTISQALFYGLLLPSFRKAFFTEHRYLCDYSLICLSIISNIVCFWQCLDIIKLLRWSLFLLWTCRPLWSSATSRCLWSSWIQETTSGKHSITQIGNSWLCCTFTTTFALFIFFWIVILQIEKGSTWFYLISSLGRASW